MTWFDRKRGKRQIPNTSLQCGVKCFYVEDTHWTAPGNYSEIWIIFLFEVEVADDWKKFQVWNFHFWLVHKIFFLSGGFTVEGKLNRVKKLLGRVFRTAQHRSFGIWLGLLVTLLRTVASRKPPAGSPCVTCWRGVDMALQLAACLLQTCTPQPWSEVEYRPLSWCQVCSGSGIDFEIWYRFSACRGELRRRKRGMFWSVLVQLSVFPWDASDVDFWSKFSKCYLCG